MQRERPDVGTARTGGARMMPALIEFPHRLVRALLVEQTDGGDWRVVRYDGATPDPGPVLTGRAQAIQVAEFRSRATGLPAMIRDPRGEVHALRGGRP